MNHIRKEIAESSDETDFDRLYEAIKSVSSELNLSSVLQKIAATSRELVGSKYSALGVLGSSGKLSQFITSGMSENEKQLIGHYPQGLGLLEVVIREEKPMRISNLSRHPEAIGFPKNHPNMDSFLGVPIIYNGTVLGNLYLTDKIQGEEFTLQDEIISTLFASQAAISIENARLFEAETRRSIQIATLNTLLRNINQVFDANNLFKIVEKALIEKFHYKLVHVNFTEAFTATNSPYYQLIDQNKIRHVVDNLEFWFNRKVLSSARENDPLLNDIELIIPIIVSGKITALIHINDNSNSYFDDTDLEILRALAEQLSMVIENIELHSIQQHQASTLAVSEERVRIGRDLHDGIIQSIYAVGLKLEDLGYRLSSGTNPIQVALEPIIENLNDVITDIRGYISELNPLETKELLFSEALTHLIQDLETRTHIQIDLKTEIDLTHLTPETVDGLWHILQESLLNIEKHAEATSVIITFSANNRSLLVTIQDNGLGFDVSEANTTNGLGLTNIRERSDILNGNCNICSEIGIGTTIKVAFPNP